MNGISELPVPGPAATAQSAQLSALLRERITAAGGWLEFSEYMQAALYEPGLGYYSGGARKFGEGGDFVTAPELGPALAHCLAQAAAPLMRIVPDAQMLELGAGSAALAIELLPALAALDALPRDYLVLEVSAELRERQQQAVAALPRELAARVRWLETLPAGFRGVMLANEVADALPVSRFRVDPHEIQVLGVELTGHGFGWASRPAAAELAGQLSGLCEQLPAALPPGYVSEFCPLLRPWIQSLAESLQSGAILLLDYGLPRHEYYHPQRRAGTLMCHYRHRAHGDPFLYPGLQDITAWVDFSAAAAAGIAAGLDLAAYASQAHFLLGNGIGELPPPAGGGESAIRHAAALRTLLLPGEMGERFKYLAFTRDIDPAILALAGDQRHRL